MSLKMACMVPSNIVSLSSINIKELSRSEMVAAEFRPLASQPASQPASQSVFATEVLPEVYQCTDVVSDSGEK